MTRPRRQNFTEHELVGFALERPAGGEHQQVSIAIEAGGDVHAIGRRFVLGRDTALRPKLSLTAEPTFDVAWQTPVRRLTENRGHDRAIAEHGEVRPST